VEEAVLEHLTRLLRQLRRTAVPVEEETSSISRAAVPPASLRHDALGASSRAVELLHLLEGIRRRARHVRVDAGGAVARKRSNTSTRRPERAEPSSSDCRLRAVGDDQVLGRDVVLAEDALDRVPDARS
jgi:hypothetical protein